MRIDIFRPNFTKWLNECQDNKTELVLLSYYRTKKHELRLYGVRSKGSSQLQTAKIYFILWDNDDSYYYSTHIIAKQAFESMSKLYYHNESPVITVKESIPLNYNRQRLSGEPEDSFKVASEYSEFIKSWINNEIKMHEYNCGKILERGDKE